MSINKSLSYLEKKLGYQFKDISLLDRALTHRSKSKNNNERLEFLGDALLETILSDILFNMREDANEGDLTRLRATMVRGATLVILANNLGIKEYIRVGTGELRTGGYRRESTLADAFEAIIAAIYIDSGDFNKTYKIVSSLYDKQLKELPNADKLKDPKTQLQELLQGKNQEKPIYSLISITGPDHNKCFEVTCQVNKKKVHAVGSSKKKAEQASAETMLTKLSML